MYRRAWYTDDDNAICRLAAELMRRVVCEWTDKLFIFTVAGEVDKSIWNIERENTVAPYWKKSFLDSCSMHVMRAHFVCAVFVSARKLRFRLRKENHLTRQMPPPHRLNRFVKTNATYSWNVLNSCPWTVFIKQRTFHRVCSKAAQYLMASDKCLWFYAECLICFQAGVWYRWAGNATACCPSLLISVCLSVWCDVKIPWWYKSGYA